MDEILEKLETTEIASTGFEIDELKFKICNKCNKNLPIESFPLKSRVTLHGTVHYHIGSCRECERQRKKDYVKTLDGWKRDEQKLIQQIKINENKKRWLKHKEKEGCFNCHGENLGSYVASFGEFYDSHHVHDDKKLDKNGKTVDISKLISSGYSWEEIEKELTKCATLCKICHQGWHNKTIFIDFSQWKNYNKDKPLKI